MEEAFERFSEKLKAAEKAFSKFSRPRTRGWSAYTVGEREAARDFRRYRY